MKRPDFFAKGFSMVRNLHCLKHGIVKHNIEVITDSPKDEVVPTLVVCLECFVAHKKLESLGIESKSPIYYQRFYVQPYVFLVLHQHFLE